MFGRLLLLLYILWVWLIHAIFEFVFYGSGLKRGHFLWFLLYFLELLIERWYISAGCVFGAVAFRTDTIFAYAHIYHLNFDIRLIDFTLFFTVFWRKLLFFVGILFRLETFAIAFVLAIVGDVDGRIIAIVDSIYMTNGTHALKVMLINMYGLLSKR